MIDDVALPSRRGVLTRGVYAASGLVLARRDVLAQQSPALTPACHDGDEPTLRETEGPFFKPRSPPRSDLREPGVSGRPVELSGLVLTRSCRPIAAALVDLWHADENGAYDMKGFRLRGHVFTGADGRYAFRTIMPGLYPGRTRHFHIKFKAPGESVLTTQYYFPDEERNAADALFRRELVMQITPGADGVAARFDVVLALR